MPTSASNIIVKNGTKNTVVSADDVNINGTSVITTLSSKQDVLTPGTGIDITNNVISSTLNSAQWGNITGTISNQTDLQTALNNKQDEATAVNYDNITNCITEIPQDIKLELNNGTLTLKAGSKVYVPNGSGVFDTYTFTEDKTATYTSLNNAVGFVYRTVSGNIEITYTGFVHSGDSAPSGATYMLWYDTVNNLVKKTTNDGDTWISGYSLPFALVYGTTSGLTAINQVFNGFGYIGSTVFALPGVKGLIPNGRNTDGSLKNIEFSLSQVQTHTITSAWGTGNECWWLNGINLNIHRAISATYFQDSKPSTSHQDAYWFSPKENILRQTTDTGVTWTQIQGSYSFNISFTSGKITSLTPKTAFHALDYNDSSTISGWSMPSSRYIDLTLGASGASYTAPANGYVAVGGQCSGYISLYTNGFVSMLVPDLGSYPYARTTIPVSKGHVFLVDYVNFTVDTFRFIYAEGDQ